MTAKLKYPVDDPVVLHARKDFAALSGNLTVNEALQHIRDQGLGEKIIYFYVVNETNQLVGVLPTRKLLTAALTEKLETIIERKVVVIPDTFTVLDACEYFIFYKYLAFPVVDAQRHILGVVDVSLYADEILDINEREKMNGWFDSLGFRISQLQHASLWRVYRFRFPWLLATVTSGALCAFLVSLYQATLAQSLVLAFFLTLVLGLGESVSVQTMTIAIHRLHHEPASTGWFPRALLKEVGLAFYLGLSCGVLVGLFVLLWQRDLRAAIVIGSGILASLLMACSLGLCIPTLLHRLNLDLKISSGPMTLAMTDVFTILTYFTIARIILG